MRDGAIVEVNEAFDVVSNGGKEVRADKMNE